MVESHFRHFLGGSLKRMFLFPFSRIDNGWLQNWKRRIHGNWQGVISKFSLSKLVRKTNAGPYDSAGEVPGGSLGMAAAELLRGFTRDGLRVALVGIMPTLLRIIHSLVSTAHQGINI
jgi:hypothetical protein